MIRLPPISTLPDTILPYTTLFRSRFAGRASRPSALLQVRMCFVGKAAVAHGRNVGLHRTGDGTAFGKEILDELRPPVAAVQAEDVVQHQHLAVAVRASADADGGDRAGDRKSTRLKSSN